MQNKYNRTQKQDLRDSIFGLSRQVTRNPKKRAWKTKKTQRKRMANMEFSTSFSFVQIGVESTASAKQQKMRMVPRVPNGNKNVVFLPFCVAQPAQCSSWDEWRVRFVVAESDVSRVAMSAAHSAVGTQCSVHKMHGTCHQFTSTDVSVCEPVCPLVPRCPECPLT